MTQDITDYVSDGLIARARADNTPIVQELLHHIEALRASYGAALGGVEASGFDRSPIPSEGDGAKPPTPLTRRQLEYYLELARYVHEHGYPPSIRELAQLLGLASSNGVAQQLAALQRKGWITQGTKRARSIQLLVTEEQLSERQKG